MSFRYEEFSEFISDPLSPPFPPPTDSIAQQFNDKIQELGDDWVPVSIQGLEIPKDQGGSHIRTPTFLVLFATRNELTGDFGKIISQFRSVSIAGDPPPPAP